MTQRRLDRTTNTNRARLLALCALLAFAACGPFAPSPPPGSSLDMGPAEDMARQTTRRRAAPGEPCLAQDDCVEDAACIGSSAGGFECMSLCLNPGGLCASGQACIELPETNGQIAICYAGGQTPSNLPCSSNLECAAGNLCFGDDATRYCIAACDPQTSQGCEPDQVCQTGPSGASYCRDALGALCEETSECPPGYMCSYEFGGDLYGIYTSGACVRQCDASEGCPGDGRCVRANNNSDLLYCLDGCSSDAECRFNQQERCRDATTCSLSSDPNRCSLLTSAGPLCMRNL